ncbi:spermatogenesis-associated protein 45 [Sarcophilus harrisii]|uniref:spermatogenesis-associated protein 45 n=1 Tax=Sarcophilus harrisii TaxID=9305 RepID=UPI001301EC21|nr:spermatogenesis-associated protein 45 [Sarcophilus harrisii]
MGSFSAIIIESSETSQQLNTMSVTSEVSKDLLDLNEQRDSRCMVEYSNYMDWLRHQRRHFLQNQHLATLEMKQIAHSDTGRSSWANPAHPVHAQRRHFPQRNNTIFG